MRRKLILNSSIFFLPDIFLPQLIWILLGFAI